MFGRGAAMAARRIRSLWMQGRFIPAARGTRFIRKFPRTEPIFEANAQNKSIAIDRHSNALSFCPASGGHRNLMSFAATMRESDDNLQQVVRLVESGSLEAGL